MIDPNNTMPGDKVLCLHDLVMEDGEVSFIKGKEYEVVTVDVEGSDLAVRDELNVEHYIGGTWGLWFVHEDYVKE